MILLRRPLPFPDRPRRSQPDSGERRDGELAVSDRAKCHAVLLCISMIKIWGFGRSVFRFESAEEGCEEYNLTMAWATCSSAGHTSGSHPQLGACYQAVLPSILRQPWVRRRLLSALLWEPTTTPQIMCSFIVLDGSLARGCNQGRDWCRSGRRGNASPRYTAIIRRAGTSIYNGTVNRPTCEAQVPCRFSWLASVCTPRDECFVAPVPPSRLPFDTIPPPQRDRHMRRARWDGMKISLGPPVQAWRISPR